MKVISFFIVLISLNHVLFSQEADINSFICLPENEIKIADYESITCEFGTFFIEIRNGEPRLSLHCVYGTAADGTGEKDLLYSIITIGLKRPLDAGDALRLNYSFKDGFLKNGRVVLEIYGGEIRRILAEKTGEEINAYLTENNYP
jgi:hypothetical protein